MRSLFRARRAEALPGGELALKLTAILLLLQPGGIWYVRLPFLVLAGLGLIFPHLLRVPATWAAITLLASVKVLRLWYIADNHHYLLVYWSLAIFLALVAPTPDQFLKRASRWLVALVFVWATLWKGVLSPDYMDGRFYRYKLLSDHRFAPVVQLVSGLSDQEMAENKAYLSISAREDETVPGGLIEPPVVRRLAMLLTWATLLLEGMVALAFLLPWGRWTGGIRHGTLLTFCVSAYAIAPVTGFGWLLATLGLAQVPERQRVLRVAYVGVAFLMLGYQYVPWGRLLLQVGLA